MHKLFVLAHKRFLKKAFNLETLATGFKDIIAGANLNTFGHEIYYRLNTDDLSEIAKISCPTNDPAKEQDIVQISKRLRAHSQIPQEVACRTCKHKAVCPFVNAAHIEQKESGVQDLSTYFSVLAQQQSDRISHRIWVSAYKSQDLFGEIVEDLKNGGFEYKLFEIERAKQLQEKLKNTQAILNLIAQKKAENTKKIKIQTPKGQEQASTLKPNNIQEKPKPVQKEKPIKTKEQFEDQSQTDELLQQQVPKKTVNKSFNNRSERRPDRVESAGERETQKVDRFANAKNHTKFEAAQNNGYKNRPNQEGFERRDRPNYQRQERPNFQKKEFGYKGNKFQRENNTNSFNRADRPPRNFEDKPRFNREERPSRQFNREERPNREFNNRPQFEDRKPYNRQNRQDRPPRFDRQDRGAPRENRQYRPPRNFEDRPARGYQDRPRNYQNKDTRSQSFDGRPPRKDYNERPKSIQDLYKPAEKATETKRQKPVTQTPPPVPEKKDTEESGEQKKLGRRVSRGKKQ